MSKWISVKDRLPEYDDKHLVYAESDNPDVPLIMVIWYEPLFGWSGLPEDWIDAISHWMPLPENPAKDD